MESLGAVGEEAHVFAEAEGADTLPKRSAMATKKTMEKGFEFEGTGNALFDFGELAGGKFFPARADGSVIAKATEEELDLDKSEAHVAGEADEKDAIEGVGRIAALTADALGRSEEAALFVIADGGGVEASAAGEFTDFHDALSKNAA